MHTRMWTSLAMVAAGLLALGGCPTNVDPRLSDQGGGNLLSATTKITQGQMQSLTADEVQYVSDFVMEQAISKGLLPEGTEALTDEEAALVVQFLQDNSISTIADLQNLIDNPGNAVITDEMRAALERLLNSDLGTGI